MMAYIPTGAGKAKNYFNQSLFMHAEREILETQHIGTQLVTQLATEKQADDFPHCPVLLGRALEFLTLDSNSIVLDATYGDGHYSAALLAQGARVIAFDRDPEAIAKAHDMQQQGGLENLTLIEDNFGNAGEHLEQMERDNMLAEGLDAIMVDLGVSSRQLDDAARGFSFYQDGALDMRMAKQGLSASDIVNQWSYAKLAGMFVRGGEKKFARMISNAILKARAEKPIDSTLQLATLIADAIPFHLQKKTIHPATLAFQAIRIEVNQEFAELQKLLDMSDKFLKKGGRFIGVSFHSLEDKIIARHFKRHQGVSRHMPDQQNQLYQLLTNKAIMADEDEVAQNSRARSARMRVAEKC